MRKSSVYLVVGAIVSLSFESLYVFCNQSVDAIYEAGRKIYPDVDLGGSLEGISKKQLYVAVYKFLDKADKKEKKIRAQANAMVQPLAEKILQEEIIPAMYVQLHAFDSNVETFTAKLLADEAFLVNLIIVIMHRITDKLGDKLDEWFSAKNLISPEAQKIINEINSRKKKQYLEKLEEQLTSTLNIVLSSVEKNVQKNMDTACNQIAEQVANELVTQIDSVCQNAARTPAPICTTSGDDATALASKIQNFDQYISVLSKYFRLNLRWADKLPVSKKKIPVKVSNRVKPLIQHIDKLKKGKVTLLSWQTVEKVFKSGGNTVQNNAFTRVAVILAEWLLYTQKSSIIDSGKDISEIMEKISTIVSSHYKNDPLRKMSQASIEQWREKMYSALASYFRKEYENMPPAEDGNKEG